LACKLGAKLAQRHRIKKIILGKIILGKRIIIAKLFKKRLKLIHKFVL
jgi:hypothetical protein